MAFLTQGMVALCSYGVSLLKAEFKFTVFLNEGTYLREYFDVNVEQYPNGGISGEIYVAEKPNIHLYIKEIEDMLIE